MTDKELIVKSVATHATSIAKVIFPGIPQQAMQTLLVMGLNNKVLNNSQITQFTDFLFDKEDNLPSPQEFWDVFKGVLNDKPFSFEVFGQKIIINGDDIEEVKKIFNEKKTI